MTRAATEDLLAKIDDVVTGHEKQRTYGRPYYGFNFDLIDWSEVGGALNRVGQAFGVAFVQIRDAMIAGFAVLQEAFRQPLPPVPAKRAHKRRYGRGDR